MCQIIAFLNDINPLISLVVAVLWGIYVYFTIKTFREIHRQTELQSEAFLVVSCDVVSSLADKTVSKLDSQNLKSYDKWLDILTTNLPTAIGPPQYAVLRLSNKGRSDIVKWDADISVSIAPGNYLREKFNIHGENAAWRVNSEGSKDIVSAGEDVPFAIAKVGPYPQISFSWQIQYSDMRGKRYTSFSGDKSKVVENSLAYSMITDKQAVKDVSMSFLAGAWSNEWHTKTGAGSEVCEVTNDGKYFINGQHAFNVENFSYNEKTREVIFVKTGIGPRHEERYNDSLELVGDTLLRGMEDNGKEVYKITYTRIRF